MRKVYTVQMKKKKAKRLDLVLHKEHIQMGNEHMKR